MSLSRRIVRRFDFKERRRFGTANQQQPVISIRRSLMLVAPFSVAR
jgi:hypothetical protein